MTRPPARLPRRTFSSPRAPPSLEGYGWPNPGGARIRTSAFLCVTVMNKALSDGYIGSDWGMSSLVASEHLDHAKLRHLGIFEYLPVAAPARSAWRSVLHRSARTSLGQGGRATPSQPPRSLAVRQCAPNGIVSSLWNCAITCTANHSSAPDIVPTCTTRVSPRRMDLCSRYGMVRGASA